MTWDDVGYIISSEYRTKVMRMLSEEPRTPSEMAEEAEIALAHISRTLTELRERDLVELLTEEDLQKGRIYGLTEDGQETWDNAKTRA